MYICCLIGYAVVHQIIGVRQVKQCIVMFTNEALSFALYQTYFNIRMYINMQLIIYTRINAEMNSSPDISGEGRKSPMISDKPCWAAANTVAYMLQWISLSLQSTPLWMRQCWSQSRKRTHSLFLKYRSTVNKIGISVHGLYGCLSSWSTHSTIYNSVIKTVTLYTWMAAIQIPGHPQTGPVISTNIFILIRQIQKLKEGFT